MILVQAMEDLRGGHLVAIDWRCNGLYQWPGLNPPDGIAARDIRKYEFALYDPDANTADIFTATLPPLSQGKIIWDATGRGNDLHLAAEDIAPGAVYIRDDGKVVQARPDDDADPSITAPSQ